MKISKKIIGSITSAAMLLTLTACSDNSGDNQFSMFNSWLSSESSLVASSSFDGNPDIGSNSNQTIEEDSASDFVYVYKKNKLDDSFEITQYIGNKTKVNIPSTIEGKPVVTICSYGKKVDGVYQYFGAFEGRSEITSVTIPNGVTEIGDSAFRDCTGLTSVTIPDSVDIIGSYAFMNCTSLTSITLPDNITRVGINTFKNCNIEVTYKGKKYYPTTYNMGFNYDDDGLSKAIKGH